MGLVVINCENYNYNSYSSSKELKKATTFESWFATSGISSIKNETHISPNISFSLTGIQ